MTAKTKEQRCDNCGAVLGVFAHSRRFDGPLSCGAKECERSARDEERGEAEEAYRQARDDCFERYRR